MTREDEIEVKLNIWGYLIIFVTMGLLPAALEKFHTFGQSVMVIALTLAVLYGGIRLASYKVDGASH